MNRKIIPRAIITILVVIVMATIIELVGMFFIMNDTIDEVEHIYLEAKHKALDKILQDEVASMVLLIKDYTQWDDLYNNISVKDYEWSYDNATGFLVEDQSYYVDFVYVEGVINDYHEYYGSLDDQSQITESALYNKLTKNNTIISDKVIIDGEVYIIAGGPIVKSSDLGKRFGYNGYYILGRKISDSYISQKLALNLPSNEYMGLNNLVDKTFDSLRNKNLARLDYEIVDMNSNPIKNLKVYFNLEDYNKNYYSFYFHTIAVTGMVALVVLVGVLYILRKSFIVIQQAIEGVDRVATGDYGYKIDETSYYEINEVIRHVNLMGVKIQDKILKLQEHNIETMGILIHAVEEKDLYTRGHSERVKDIALIIAKEMDAIDIDLLEQAAILHDIGKIGIHDDILNKPGKLTHEEYELIKEHPEKGERILSSSSRMSKVARIVRQHHEWYDGSGYPDGIQGEEIYIEARIISVADAFDAITSKRPYRSAKSFKTGIEIIMQSKGSQFDPRVVDAFLKSDEEIRAVVDL
jgi:putative nucleotidyltransferase with HDIG domain